MTPVFKIYWESDMDNGLYQELIFQRSNKFCESKSFQYNLTAVKKKKESET